MGIPFYKFDQSAFRDSLRDEYLLPVARWFLWEPGNAYLLPQASGSSWECAMAMEFLVGLEGKCQLEASLAKQIKTKCVQTAGWLMDQVVEEANGGKSWDGAQWDTAVVLRAIIQVFGKWSAEFSEARRDELLTLREDVGTWLVGRVMKWNDDARYFAGPPDLAQVLNTLILLRDQDAEVLAKCESRAGHTGEDGSIDDAARLLIALSEPVSVTSAGDPPETVVLHHWVDAFNTGEVMDALSRFARVSFRQATESQKAHQLRAKELVMQSLRYVECNQQSEGTWGGVVDTCGTLYYYLMVALRLENCDHQDHVVFKALRWMCDENQTLPDGSFLHSAYPTVFYALALLEAYENWALGRKSAAEVYDVALWLAPNLVAHERTRRLELELRHEDLSKRVAQLNEQHTLIALRETSLLVGAIGIVLVIVVLLVSRSLEVSIVVMQPSTFWGVFLGGLTLTGMAIGGIRRFAAR